MFGIGFIGSSLINDSVNLKETDLFINELLDFALSLDNIDHLRVVSGGYMGTMEVVSKSAHELRDKHPGKLIESYGILFNGYKNDPDNSYENQPNKFNDHIMSTFSIGERVQTIIELSDLIVALPGSFGTLHEIMQIIEHIRYGMSYNIKEDMKLLSIHEYWKTMFSYFTETKMVEKTFVDKLNFFNYSLSDYSKMIHL